MRAALTDDAGRVVNVILIGDDYEPPPGLSVHDLDEDSRVGLNWRLEGGEFLEPDPVPVIDPVPDPVAGIRSDLDWLINYVITGEG